MAASPQYELGTLVGGTWRQWSNSAGQDYYENLNTRATQYDIPVGWEDADTDTWAVDGSKSWPQWRTNPNPPAPRTYLDKVNVQTHLQLVERSPESHEYLYRRVMIAVLKHFFLEDEGFDVLQEESRGELDQNELRVDMAVLKITSRPGGSLYAYDYCLVESKKADRSWTETEHHLSRHCASTENQSGQVYGIVHIGLYVQFFTADRGVLTALSGGLHIRNDVNAITTMFGNMKRQPLPCL
ncbi:uncharacterized protein BDR25DRAFT_319185 [Lindgomyces ingoldianus]|uniref:Uncharacterized protein n=1 Tax=Lindgomyces ingoldianus TaxID=673940 RepID=A0ACB6QBM1_9PLEO|nr:uncharacterized protein BDR25DRAFT_319185 [Lindgomyces ingoldianus]KAF2464444.1 hypothetical protein BDR25DRAFT_319185 [Lindgomyces ingoldianus]